MRRLLLAAIALLALAPAAQADPPRPDVRFATFNASLNRSNPGQLVDHLSHPEVDDVFRRQARNVAEVIQRNRPDVLLINEFDYAPAAVDLFRDNFLEVSQNGATPIHYPYAFIAPSNTGIPSGMDFSNDGVIGGPNDAFGFGFFPGQFGMVVYSKYPIHMDQVRTFQLFRWEDMPGALLPDDPSDTGSGRLVLAGRAGHLPALVEEPLGHPDRRARPGRALPRQPSDAAGVRRSAAPSQRGSTSTDAATTTRSGSGPTTSRRDIARTTSTTIRAGAAGSIPARGSSSRETRTRIRSTATASRARRNCCSSTIA